MIDFVSDSETKILTMEQILAVIRRIYAEEQAQQRRPVKTEQPPASRYLS